jgi:glycosyltransferase involved in cell wall biosynthesis
MKILMVHKTRVGGVARYVYEVKKKLERKGHSVNEVTRLEDLKRKRFWQAVVPLRKTAGEYDVVHSHDWSIAIGLLGLENHVATFHGFPTNPFAFVMQNRCIKVMGKRAIVVSPRMKRRYKNATMIVEGVDLEEFKPKKKKFEGVVGVCQGYNLDAIRKGVNMAGMKLIEAKGISLDKMPGFYDSVDIFISLPPKTTGFNLVWLEAMASGKPTIGNKWGIGEVLPIDKVRDNEPSEIAEKVKSVRYKNYRQWIKEHEMTWKKHVDEMIKVYELVGKL